jgi:hypothetical protein
LRTLALVALAACLLAASPAAAQPSVDTLVAKALVEQAEELALAGRCPEARRLVGEAVARDPRGPYAARARALAARCGRAPASAPAGGLRDPYADEGVPPRPAAVPAALPPPRPVMLPEPAGVARASATSYAEWRRGRDRRAGRVQLTVALGLFGAYAGPAAAVMADLSRHDEDSAVAAGILLGPAAGVGLGLLLSSPAD